MANRKYVLVLEDEVLLSRAIVSKLEQEDMQAVSFGLISQAINYVKKNGLPSVVWLDYYLIDGNGVEFMKKFYQTKSHKDIPVVVVSNSATQEKIDDMLELGAKEYLPKAENSLDNIVKHVKVYY